MAIVVWVLTGIESIIRFWHYYFSVFKTNTSYQRWDEARKAWGSVVNHSRTILRETSAWIHKVPLSDEEKYDLVRRVADAVWLFPRSLQRHLLQPAEDEDDYRKDVLDRVTDRRLAQELLMARHKPSLALFELSSAINEIPLDTVQRTMLDKAVSQLCDAMGRCVFCTCRTLVVYAIGHALILNRLLLLLSCIQ